VYGPEKVWSMLRRCTSMSTLQSIEYVTLFLHPGSISKTISSRRPLIAHHSVHIGLISQWKHNSKFIVCHIKDGCESRAREGTPRRRREIVRADIRIAHEVILVRLDLNDIRVCVSTQALVGRRRCTKECCDYHFAMHQNSSPPAPRLVKQVSRKFGRLPGAFATEHCPTTRLSEYTVTYPVPGREQYL